MSEMLFLMFVQSLFQFGAKEGKWEGYYGQKNYLDMSSEKEIIIRSKHWNFIFCGNFFFFSCSFRLSLVTDIKLDCGKFAEEILENIAIATRPKSQVLIYPRSLWISKEREDSEA